MTFGEVLKRLRDSRGLTQQDIATLLKVGRSTIAGYETKGKQPDFEKLKILANFFNVTIDYLLGRTDEINYSSTNDKITKSLSDDPELSEFWNTLKEREDLKLLFKQTKDLSPNDVKKIIRIIKAIEDEEDKNDV
ncbi:MAG: helix-turn-helix transcriptional regulator [Clostridium sp.]|nr:helix-turn-helix transcriptional regulator [Clostridium sp.]